MSVYKKLQSARIELYKAGLKQSGANKHSNTTYFELVDFTVDAQRIFNDVGLSSVFSMTSENATLSIVDVDTWEKADFSCPVFYASLPKETEKSVKNLGATITYLRRYLWMSALEIPQKEVAELVENHNKTQATAHLDTEFIKECTDYFKANPKDYAGLAGIIETLDDEYLVVTTAKCLRNIDSLEDLSSIAGALTANKESKGFQSFMKIRQEFTARKQQLGG